MVLTIERRADAIPGLVRVADNFERGLLKPSHGSAGFCRPALGCEGWVSETLGTFDCRFPIAHLRVPGLCVVGVHLPPPVSHCVQGRAPYLDALLPHLAGGRIVDDWGACRAGDAAVVIGDLNGVPHGPAWRALRERGLRDALPWSGVIAGTWPAGGGWGWLPVLRLDHALVGAAAFSGTRRARLPGSDHLALVVEGVRPLRPGAGALHRRSD